MHKKDIKMEEDLNIALQNHRKNNFKIAEKIYRKILKAYPDHFQSIFHLGTLFLQTKKFDEAKQMFIKSTQIKPGDVNSYNNLGIALNALGEFQEAVVCYEKAIKMQPNYAYAYNNLGNTLKKLLKFQKAIDYYQKAVEVKPDYTDAHKNLMQILERQNQEKELKTAILNARTSIKDNSVVALYEGVLLFKNGKFNEAKNCLEQISFANVDVNLNKETLRVHTLAKCYDRMGNFDEAFTYFLKANNFFPQQEKVIKFDKNKFLEDIKIKMEFFKECEVNKWLNFKPSSKISDPVFLIGFPRSGTTLLDIIMRSHPMIEVIEEKNIFSLLNNPINKLPQQRLDDLKNMQSDQIEELRNEYFNLRESIVHNKKNSKLYIDKLPLNIIRVGEMIRIFPNAKFIFSLRHPCDCVLSCFMQDFKLNDAMANFLNLDDTAHLYDAVMNLWIQYISIFSINYHVIKYENLVENFEPKVKSVLNFLGLPWNDTVVEYLKTAKSIDRINTPSYSQVIKPIYKHAIGRWECYKKQISNIYPILEPWIKRFKY